MEDKEKIALTVFGVVAIIAVVGLIGIFNKPTYILLQTSGSEPKQTQADTNKISGMAVYDLTREQCLNYKKIYSRYAWFDDWQFFKDNCEAKYDLSEPERCTTGYLDEYKCEGDYSQRKWQNNQCEVIWRYFQYCEYGCLNGQCTPKPAPEASHKISSKADSRTEICTEKYLYDYRCYGSNSQRLYQNTDCSTGYKEYEVCNKGCNIETGRCNIEMETRCSEGYLDEYKCSGSYLQRVYQYPNCLKTFQNYRFCSSGCSNNKCN